MTLRPNAGPAVEGRGEADVAHAVQGAGQLFGAPCF